MRRPQAHRRSKARARLALVCCSSPLPTLITPSPPARRPPCGYTGFHHCEQLVHSAGAVRCPPRALNEEHCALRGCSVAAHSSCAEICGCHDGDCEVVPCAAFAGSSVHDAKDEKKWVFRIPILADFGGQVTQRPSFVKCCLLVGGMLTDAVAGHGADGQGRVWGRGARTSLDLQQPDQGAGHDPAATLAPAP
jgi:hypothetical protein